MALINCPECNKEISEHAVSCPNCGYKISSAPKSTPLGPVKTSGSGVAYIIVGVLIVLMGLFTMGIIIGFLFVFVGLGFIGVGANKLSGEQEGRCPYCDSPVTMRAKDTTYKCGSCKNVSKKTDTTLEQIK